ncbi:MAG: ankyrin repeat domain-containing protein [Elusimicrobiaceae bacterium]|nr:ankyrin repeat domain-containing protein [Elusimicrobiaceae bacterium]
MEKWLATGGNVNITDENGNTPLYYAVGYAGKIYDPTNFTGTKRAVSKKTINLLLEKGANVNVKNNNGATPIYRSFGSGTTQILLDQGAILNTQDNDGDTPLHAAVLGRYSSDLDLLLEKGANVNAQNKKARTPLHILVITSFFDSNFVDTDFEKKRDLAIAQNLLTYGSNVNLRDNDGKTPLMLAQERGFTEMVNLLKSAGATE